MGTTFFTSEMHPAYGRTRPARKRQVEVYRPSGEEYLSLRIGDLDEEDAGGGVEVMLDEAGAREVLSGLVAGMNYLGFKTGDLV